MLRIIALGVVLLFASSASAEVCPIAWDDTFKKSTRVFMPQRLKGEWKYLKAQAITESSCRANVCSHAGACGVMQIMRATWREVQKDDYQSIFEARKNIRAGVKYMAWQSKNWLGRDRSNREILDLGSAGYNAGLGNILKAQIACNLERTWPEIHPCLPGITGHHSEETIAYVERINRWHGRL